MLAIVQKIKLFEYDLNSKMHSILSINTMLKYFFFPIINYKSLKLRNFLNLSFNNIITYIKILENSFITT